MSTERKITLRSSDDETFEVEESVASMSQIIKHMIEDNCTDQVIPVPNVTARILAKVIEYCEQHVADAGQEAVVSEPEKSEEMKRWDADLIEVDQNTLFDLFMAANYLNIKSLLDLTCMAVANLIKGKSPEEIRRTFNIKNDFTPEEEEEVKRETQWAFEWKQN